MTKFVVWGIGHRGRILYELLGTGRIIAFIDSNPEKIGSTYKECPIIDYDTYKQNYRAFAIIVSMTFGGGVTELLEKDQIFYFSVEKCPPEFMGYGLQTAKHVLEGKKLDIPEHLVLYGSTLYTILIYERLQAGGYEDISVFLPSYVNRKEQKMFFEMFPKIDFVQLDEINTKNVLLTEKVKQLEPELKGSSIIDIVDWTKYISDYYNPGIEALKNKHQGERCFIVATGPSLSYDDLACLDANNAFCISMNSIFTCFSKTCWRPDCYAVLDADGILLWKDQFHKMTDIPYKFIADSQPDYDYAQLDSSWHVYHSILDDFSIRNMLFSEDFSRTVYNGATIVYVCIQLAVYLGFKKIYLLGVDYSYKKNMKNHFTRQVEPDEKFDGMNEQNRIQDISYLAFQKAEEYAGSHGIKIYNATRNTCLDVFELADFKTLF